MPRIVPILFIVSAACSFPSNNEPAETPNADVAEALNAASLAAPPENPPEWSVDGVANDPVDLGNGPHGQAEAVDVGVGAVRVWTDWSAPSEGAIGLRFGDAMVPTVDSPIPQISLEPAMAGTWSWAETNILRFTPDDALPAGVPYATVLEHPRLGDKTVRITGTTPYFQFAGKVASWPVEVGSPRFVGFINQFTMAVGDGPIVLLFDQPVDPSILSRMIQVTGSNGAPLATRFSAPTDVSYASADTAPSGHLVAVTVADLPESGTVDIVVPTGDGVEEHTLSVRRGIALDDGSWMDEQWESASDERLPLSVRWSLSSTTPIAVDQIREALRIEPEPLSMSVSGYGNSYQVAMSLEQGTEYWASMNGLVDVLGNTQDESMTWQFRTKDHVPMVALPSLPVAVESGRGVVDLHVRNAKELTARASAVSEQDFSRGMLANGTCSISVGSAVELAMPAFETTANTLATVPVTLPQGTGLWCVEVSGEGVGTEASGSVASTVLVQASNLGVTAKVSEGSVFAWMTELADPQGVAGGRVDVVTATGTVVGTGVTAADGTATIALDEAHGHGVSESLVLLAHRGDETVAVLLRDDRMSAAWQLGLRGATEGTQTLAASLFTERGAYRPGDDVQLTFLGGPDMKGDSVVVRIVDAQGQEALQQEVVLDDFGVATLEVPTAESASVGPWQVVASHDGAEVRHRFRVEEYRVPTFEVGVTAPEAWQRDTSVTAVLDGAYLHGGTLDGRAVSWEVRREPVAFNVPGYARYRFAVDNASISGIVASGDGRLDGSGTLPVTFSPSHPASAGPVRYTVDATVTDVDRQAYLGRTSRVVHPADFYIGVEPPSRRVLSAGETIEVPVIAVTPSGESVQDVPVRLRLERVDHHTTTRMTSGAAQVLSRPVEVERDSCLVRTTQGTATCSFTVPEAGQWRVRAWSQDADGNDVVSGFAFRAGGDEVAAWPRFDHERIDVRADKPSYSPGDVARLIVESPFDEAFGLLTLERDGIVSHQEVRISGDTPVIEVPITGEHAPNIYATLSLLRGRTHNDRDASGFETGAPAFRLGTVELSVTLDAQELAVTASPDRDIAAPGEGLTVDVFLEDDLGRPVTGQATVMVVDEAVLGLTGMQTPNPLAGLFPNQPLGVRTADSRLELPHARRARHEVLFPGGDGGVIEGQIPANLLRSLFESTAFFEAQVPVTSGRGQVSFDLPDNTTTYRVMVVAIDEDGRAGSTEHDVVVRKPLMVQAVTPRFVYPGDTLQVEALLHNGTEEDAQAVISGGFVGLDGVLNSTTVSIAAGGTARVPVAVEVSSTEDATIRFTAQMGAHMDAIEVTLPVLEPGVSRTQVVSETVSGPTQLQIALPADRVRGSESLEVVASTTALTELKDAVGYLMGYPNGCIEQTTSRAYPLVMLEDLLPEIGVEVDRAQLREYSEAGVARILSFQTEGGGLSYWPGGTESHAFATSFGLTALIEAKKKGYDVPDEALVRMGDYLVETLSKGDVTETIAHGSIADGDTRALFVMTLGRLGRPQPAWVESLWVERDKLTPFGLSFLAIAATEMNADHPLAGPILAEVERRAETDSDEAWYEGDSRGGYSMDSPLRSHATALLASATGGGQMTSKYLQGLLGRRQGGLWGNTQENVFGVMAIAALAKADTNGSAPGLTLAHNGQALSIDGMQAPSSRVRRQVWGHEDLDANVQTVTADFMGGSPVTVTLRATYDLALTDANRAATSSGATVERTYTTVDGQPIGDTIELGSLVVVTLTVNTDDEQNYVAIDDKLPAGLEPLNTDLATTERVDLGTLTPALERGIGLLSYREIRDHRVAFYADEMPAGTVSWRYVARATTPGTFLRPASRVEAMYDADVFASSEIDSVTIR